MPVMVHNGGDDKPEVKTDVPDDDTPSLESYPLKPSE